MDLKGIRLPFSTTHVPRLASGLGDIMEIVFPWLYKLTCLVRSPMMHALDAVRYQVSGSNYSSYSGTISTEIRSLLNIAT